MWEEDVETHSLWFHGQTSQFTLSLSALSMTFAATNTCPRHQPPKTMAMTLAAECKLHKSAVGKALWITFFRAHIQFAVMQSMLAVCVTRPLDSGPLTRVSRFRQCPVFLEKQCPVRAGWLRRSDHLLGSDPGDPERG